MKKRASLRDVATAAGVSIGTASQALRGMLGTSRATQEKVQYFANQLGYRPNPVMASLASRKFHAPGALQDFGLAFVANPPRHHAFRHESWLGHLTHQSEKMGYRFESHFLASQDECALLARKLYWQGVQGIVFGLFTHPEWLEKIEWSDFSIVWLGGRCSRPFLHTIKTDVSSAVADGVERLASLGFTSVGMVSMRHDPEQVFDDDLREGMMEQCRRKYPELCSAPVLRTSFTDPDAASSLLQWYETHRPSVVLGLPKVADLLAETCTHFVRQTSFCSLAVETARSDVADMGYSDMEDELSALALAKLNEMIRHKEKGLPKLAQVLQIAQRWVNPVG